MKSIYRIQEIQHALFKMRVEKGEYLSDVTYEKLTPSQRRELYLNAKDIYENTNLDVKKVWRGDKKVWRFVERA